MRWRWCASLVAAVLGLAAAGPLRAEPIEIELEMVMQSAPGQIAVGERTLHRPPRPQDFHHMHFSGGGRLELAGERFAAAVQSEPSYRAEHPLRQVAQLAGQDFAFVLDKKEEDSELYEVLYFDRNGRGDLAHEEPIEVATDGRRVSGESWTLRFPPIDLELSSGGICYPYRVVIEATCSPRQVTTGVGQVQTIRQIRVSLAGAAHREGMALVGGVPRRFILLDQMSTGRFDRFPVRLLYRIPASPGMPAEEGETLQAVNWLLVDPEPSDVYASQEVTAAPGQHLLSSLLQWDGEFYDVAVTPGGERLTLTPSARPTGQLRGAGADVTAVFFGEPGAVTVEGGPDRPMVLPEGEWRLLSYTIDLTGREQREAEVPTAAEEGSLLPRLAQPQATVASPPNRPPQRTVLHAAARGGAAVNVVAGEVVESPLGPPFRPVIQVTPDTRREGTVNLGVVFLGAYGEWITHLLVAGTPPAHPTFQVLDPNDEVVASGQFEYG